MSQNYQYLHSVVRGVYKDLPVAKSDAVPSELMAEVRKYASVFDGQEIGLSDSYCYFMIPDAKGIPNLFFAKIARKQKSTSLCHYIQCAGWAFNNVYRLPDGAQLPSDDFDSIFDFRFYTEDEVDAYAAGNAAAAFGSGSATIGMAEPFPIAPEAIRAILHGVAGRWITGSAPVYIEVPDGVDYNAYVMRAVKQIYSYFPVAFKTNVGFASYIAPEAASHYLHVSIVFVPRSKATRDTIRLDGSSTMACKTLVSTSFGTKLNAFMEHLAYLTDEAAREEFLKSVLIDAEYSAAEDKIGSIKPMRYAVLGSSLSILKMQGTVEEMFPQWLDFAENKTSYPQGIARQITRRINTELNPEDFAKLLRNGNAVAYPTNTESLNATLNKLYKICDKRQELYQVLWKYTAAVLKKGILSDEATFDWLVKNKGNLCTFTDSESYEQLKAEYAALCTAKIWKAAEAKITETPITNREEYRKISQNVAAGAVTDAGKYEDVTAWMHKLTTLSENRIAADLQKALQQLKTRVPATADQYKIVIGQCRKLMNALPEAGIYAQADSLRAEAQQYLDSLNQEYNVLINSVGTLVASFENKYFVAIDKYEAKKNSLTEDQKQEVERELNKLRPVGLAKYRKAYEQQTGKKLSASALIHENPAAGDIIRKDLMKLLSHPIDINIANRSAADIAAELEYYIALSKFFGTGRNVTVRIKLPDSMRFDFGSGDMELSAAVLRDIVSLTLEKQNASSESEEAVYAIVSALYSSGAIQPEHEYAILEMLQRCGYSRAVDWLYAKTNNLEGTQIKEDFRRQFESKAKKRQAKRDKQKNMLLAGLGGLSAVLLVVVVVLVIMLLSANKKLKEVDLTQPYIETTVSTQDAQTVPETTVAVTEETQTENPEETTEPTVPEEAEPSQSSEPPAVDPDDILPDAPEGEKPLPEASTPGKVLAPIEKATLDDGTYSSRINN